MRWTDSATLMPSVDEAEAAVLAIAAGEWREEGTATWLRQYLVAPDQSSV
jgi:hypothetical protein